MGPSKQCPRCRQDLPLTQFNYRDKARTRIQSYCRTCSNDAWREWYSQDENKLHHLQVLSVRRKRRIARNKALVQQLKRVPCADCGGLFPPEAMDFDHLNDKTGLISKLVFSVGKQRLLDEIDKCQVVCANCHRIRTSSRLIGEIE